MKSVQVLSGCDVRTLDEANRRAEALAWCDGELLAVGSRQVVERAAGADAEIWDGAGLTVLPGFIDAHHHPSLASLYGGLVRLDPPGVTDIPGVQRALAAAAEGLPSGSWLVATDWDEMLLDERRPPTREELDDAVPDRPVMALHYSCHRALANSRALELAGIGRETPEPSGGIISRGRGGLPDGLLIERGMSRVESLARASLIARDVEGYFERLGRHHRDMAAAGITRIVDATVPGDLAELYREAARRGLIVVPTVMLPVSTAGWLEAPWDVLEGPVTGERDGVLEVGPIKLVFDGAPGCAMCLGWWQTAGVAMNAWAMAVKQRSFDVVRNTLSVSPRVGRAIRTGIHIYRQDEGRDIVRSAAERGFAVATHAIGNEAVDHALRAYEAAGSVVGRKGMPRLEHATFLSRDLVARIADVGAAVVTQPHLMSLPAFGGAPSIPGVKNAPLRWLLDAGVDVAGSSDYPVAGFRPLDGIRSAVNRMTSRGHAYEPDQCIELDEAIALYTRAAAKVCGCIDRCGTLVEGKRADLVVLDGMVRTESDVAEAKVRATVIGGEVVFGSLGSVAG